MGEWLAIGEIREGVESMVVAALGLEDGSLDRGRHSIVAADEVRGELREPRVVTLEGDDVRIQETTHEQVARIALREFLDFAEGVTFERATERIYVDRPLEVERAGGMPSLTVALGAVDLTHPEAREEVRDPRAAAVVLVGSVQRDRRVRDLTLVSLSRNGDVLHQRELEEKEAVRMAHQHVIELDNDVHLVGTGEFIAMEVSHECAWAGVHAALEETMLPGAGVVQKALAVVENAERVRSVADDHPHVQHSNVQQAARERPHFGNERVAAREREREAERDRDSGLGLELDF